MKLTYDYISFLELLYQFKERIFRVVVLTIGVHHSMVDFIASYHIETGQLIAHRRATTAGEAGEHPAFVLCKIGIGQRPAVGEHAA